MLSADFKLNLRFAYDWEVLHHIDPATRRVYVQNVARLLRPEAHYLSVCFSEKDPQFGGKGNRRITPIGTTLYFSSEDEMRELFEEHFRVLDLTTIEVEGKTAPHLAVYALMETSGA